MPPTTTTTTTTTMRPTTTTTTTMKPTTTTTTTTMKPTTTTTTTTMKPTTTTTTTTTMRPTSTTTTTQPTIPTFFPPINCYCVYTWQCDANGFIIVDGSGVINPRQTYYPICLLPNQICCRVNPYTPQQPVVTYFPPITSYPSIDPRPYTPPTTLPTLPPAQTTFPTFLPGQTCMCILLVQCNVFGYIPINGPGNIDPRYTLGSLQEIGSSCSNPQQVCCRITFSVSQVLPTFTNIGSQEVKYPGTTNACICVKSWTCAAENVVLPDGFGIIDPRFGSCPIENEVCCKLSNANVILSTGIAFTTSTLSSAAPKANSENACGFISKTFAPGEGILFWKMKLY